MEFTDILWLYVLFGLVTYMLCYLCGRFTELAPEYLGLRDKMLLLFVTMIPAMNLILFIVAIFSIIESVLNYFNEVELF